MRLITYMAMGAAGGLVGSVIGTVVGWMLSCGPEYRLWRHRRKWHR